MPLLFGIGPTYRGPNGKAIAFGNIDLVEPDFFALNAVWFHRWFASSETTGIHRPIMFAILNVTSRLARTRSITSN